MLRTQQNFIPVLTSEAGSCITVANWQEVGCTTASYYLDSLLLKPGAEFLKSIPDLATYLGWSGSIILNASRLVKNKADIYILTSPFDGSKIQLGEQELFALILQLKPHAVVFPKNTVSAMSDLWPHWPEAIRPFFSATDLLKQELNRDHGVYYNLEDASNQVALIEQLKTRPHLPHYIAGHVDTDFLNTLLALNIEYIESDAPAHLAMQGQVYNREGVLHVTDEQNIFQFETIEADCQCPTCLRSLTKAYLHHLYLHTPLLCQRFLIQHNVHYAQTRGK